jgi:hypothetical protein
MKNEVPLPAVLVIIALVVIGLGFAGYRMYFATGPVVHPRDAGPIASPPGPPPPGM